MLTMFGVNCMILLGGICNNAQPELKKKSTFTQKNPQNKIADFLLVVANDCKVENVLAWWEQ